MYSCEKCGFETKFQSKYKQHINRKTTCIKDNLRCKYCNIVFTCIYNKKKHDETNKHIANYNNAINSSGDQNVNQIGDNNTVNINHIINLTLQTQPFTNTDFSYLRKWIIEDVGNHLYIKVMKEDYVAIQDKIKSLFRGTIEILEHLHFNLNNENNHNLKILLMFPGFKKPIYEYLILEIEPITNKITWNTLNYQDFITELFIHLKKMNDIVNNENFDKYLYFLKQHLIYDAEMAAEMKPHIENKLNELYINFNLSQKKAPREIKLTIEEKIKEFQEYRNQETRLHNGYSPPIINSQI